MKTSISSKSILLFIIIATALLLTACGGGSSPAITPTQQSLSTIADYSQNPDPTKAPTVDDYHTLGIESVTSSNIADVNLLISRIGHDNVDTQGDIEDTLIKREDALAVIMAYASGSSNVAPTVETYRDLSITGVTEANLNEINRIIAGLTSDEVDTIKELLDIVPQIPTPTATPTPTPTPMPTPTPTPTPTQTPIPSPSPNHVPTANSQTVVTPEDTAKTIMLTGEDTDGDSLHYTVIQQPIHGTLSGTVPALTYTPSANFNGSDSFRFKVNDSTVDSNEAMVDIAVRAVNDTPIVTLEGNTTVTLNAGDSYTEQGASAYDIEDGNISNAIVITSNVDTTIAGSYTVRYSVIDSNGTASNEVVRDVHVVLKVFDFPAMKQIALDKSFVRPASLEKLASYSIRLAKGEYHSVAMLIEPEGNQTALTAQNDHFLSAGGSLDKSIMDTYIAKRWFQAGDVKPGHETLSMYNYTINGQPTSYYNQKWLTQELLLKDETLVQVDFANETNTLRVIDRASGSTQMIAISSRDDTVPDTTAVIFDDAQTLQPFDLVQHQHKLLWSIIHIPTDAQSGIYTSTFTIKNSDGVIVKSVPVQIEVLPFALDASKLTYSIYYTARQFDPTPRINTAKKTTEKHRILLQNLKEHGILYPNTYFANANDFRIDLQIRKALGFPMDRVYTLGAGLFPYINTNLDANTITQIVNKINDFKNVYDEEGYATGGLYVYGFDEPGGSNIQKEIDAIRQIRENVDIHFFATGDYRHYSGERIVDDVDLLVFPRYTLDTMILRREDNSSEWKYAIDASRDMVDLYHTHGKKIFIYDAPQGGVESAEVYRKNYGIRLWKEGYEGAMDFAYQYGRVFVWNDFLSTGYRDETLVYPTTNGVINTVEWEGFRQAITDVRYLSTLSNLRDTLSGSAQQEIDTFLNSLDPNGDLDDLREEMIGLVLKYRE